VFEWSLRSSRPEHVRAKNPLTWEPIVKPGFRIRRILIRVILDPLEEPIHDTQMPPGLLTDQLFQEKLQAQ
jgi:hypothetical protein